MRKRYPIDKKEQEKRAKLIAPFFQYLKTDGDNKAWELEKSAKEFFWENDPVYLNINLFIKLRNKIEHRFMPGINSELVWECQATLINFESLLIKEFWEKYSLTEHLFIPLQFTSKKRPISIGKDEKDILEFIKQYRNSIDTNISWSQEYSFKMFIVPKLGNHRNSSDTAVEFIKFDPGNAEDMKKYEKVVIWIKEKQVPVANQWKYRPWKVLRLIQDKTGVEMNQAWHTSMWKKYDIRPTSWSSNPQKCNSKYCQFDEASTHKDYIYTDDWVNLLIEKEIKAEKLS